MDEPADPILICKIQREKIWPSCSVGLHASAQPAQDKGYFTWDGLDSPLQYFSSLTLPNNTVFTVQVNTVINPQKPTIYRAKVTGRQYRLVMLLIADT
jgi:hypothetical protein